MATAEVSLRANITQLRNEISKIPGITEGEAKKMVSALAGQMKRAEAAAKAASKAGKEGADQWKASLTATEKAASVLGGTVGSLLARSKSLVEGLGAAEGALGTLGIGAGIAGAALLAVGTAVAGGYRALSSLADASEVANKRLAELSGSEGPSLAAAAATARWRDEQVQLEAATAGLTNALTEGLLPAAAELLPSLTEIVRDTKDWVDVLNDARAMLMPVKEEIDGLASALIAVGSLGFVPAVSALRDFSGANDEGVHHVTDLHDAVADLTAAEKDQLYQLGFLIDEERDYKEAEAAAAEATRKAAEAQREAEERARAHAQALREVRAASDALAQSVTTSNRDTLSSQDEIRQVFEDQLAAIAAAEETSGDHYAAESARAAALSRELRDLAAADAKDEADRAKGEQADADAKLETERAAAEARELAISQLKAQRKATLDLTRATLQGAADSLDGLMSLVTEGGTAYKVLFGARQAAALGMAVVNTAEAVTAGLTLPPPMGEIAAASRGIAGGVEIATIAAATIGGLKKSHSGSSGVAPDEQITLRAEGVLSHIGTSTAGGSAGVAAMNRGEMPGGSQGEQRAVLQWRNRIFDGPLGELGQTPGSSLYRLGRDGRKAGRRPRSTRNRLLVGG